MIVRGENTSQWTPIPNKLLEDNRLSFKARGIACFLLSKPPGWRISRQHLANCGPDGLTAVRTALKELEATGYLHRTRLQNPETGHFEWHSVLYDHPQENASTIVRFSTDGKSIGGKSIGGKSHPIVNTDIDHTEVVNTDIGIISAAAAENPTSVDKSFARIIALYENEIGLLTAMIRDSLNDWYESVPSEWIEDAIRAAARYNKRSLAYIEAILRRWQNEGRTESQSTNQRSHTNGTNRSNNPADNHKTDDRFRHYDDLLSAAE